MLCVESSLPSVGLPGVFIPSEIQQESLTKHNDAFLSKHGRDSRKITGNTGLENNIPSVQLSSCCKDDEDKFSWNHVIQKHVEDGDTCQAFSVFNEMQENHMLPSKSTYRAMLQACAKSVSLGMGYDLHMKITREGWDMDSHMGISLTGMYMKCSALNDAKDVFDKLPDRNVILWTTLMLGYVNCGLARRALDFLDEMQADMVSPDAVAFVCGLKACGSIGNLDWGHELYGRITKGGFEGDPFVSNALISMYVKCGQPLEAHQVFEKLVCPDVVAWNVLINGYADYGYYEDAFHLLKSMKKEEVVPTAITFLGGLKACDGLGAIKEGQELHRQIIEDGLEQSLPIGNALLGMYAKCGLLVESQSIFDDMPIQDVVSWSALIAGYSDKGCSGDALNCLERMQIEGVSPEIPTFVSSLKACASLTALNIAQKIHAIITAKGLTDNLGVSNSLIDTYAKCGLLEDSYEVFESMQDHDVISWNALIAGYIDHGFGEEASNLLGQMQSRGVPPSIVTYVCALKAFIMVGALDKGQRMYSEIVAEGFETDIYVSNTIIDMYLKCGGLLDAQGAFEELSVRDTISWSALLMGYAERGQAELVHELFEQMKVEVRFTDVNSWDALIFGFTERGEIEEALRYYAQMQEQCLLPSTTSFVSLLNLCSDVAALKIGKQIHALVHGLMLDYSNVPLANALVDMYCGCGSTREAHQLFEALASRDVVTWNTLVNGHSRQGESGVVFGLLMSMQKDGTEPESVTLQSALMASNHAGLLGEGKAYFENIAFQFGKSCTLRHYHSMADLLGRAGHVEEAAALLDTMPFQPDLVTWGTILDACNKWGYMSVGAHAFDCAKNLDKRHTSSFVSMSNMSVEAWLWEE